MTDQRARETVLPLVAQEEIVCGECKRRGIKPLEAVPSKIKPGQSISFYGAPQSPFKPQRLRISCPVPDGLYVVGIICGSYVVGLSAGRLPLRAFLDKDDPVKIDFPTCQIAQQYRVVVENATKHDMIVEMFFEGLEIR